MKINRLLAAFKSFGFREKCFERKATLLLCKNTTRFHKQFAETVASLAERGLVKVALCSALAVLPVCIAIVDVNFIHLIQYDSDEVFYLVQNATLLLSIAHPYILLIVGSKVREHFVNDWFFWK
jgi:hypothetical protein